MEDNSVKQTVTVINRKSMVADCVNDIESFSGEYLVVNTQYGKLFVEGDELKIGELIKAEKRIVISGNIKGVYFKDESEIKGFFKRAFK